LASALILAACGGSTTGGASTLNVGTSGDQLVFDPPTLRANANAQITVTFKNNASTLQHNWVLVKGGDDVAAIVGLLDIQGIGITSIKNASSWAVRFVVKTQNPSLRWRVVVAPACVGDDRRARAGTNR